MASAGSSVEPEHSRSIDEAFSIFIQAFRSGGIPRDEIVRCRRDSDLSVAY